MSGHSKWSSIKHKKALKDARRGKLFTKFIKEITVAARLGGGDINANPRLRTAVTTARQNSMPTDNIERAIKKGTGELEGVSYEEITYEAYGPGGVAILVQVLTDNRNRTVADVRSIITKHGGNLAAAGAVAWMFHKRGLITVERAGVDEDRVMEVALEGGAEDVREAGDLLEIITAPEQFDKVKEALDQARVPVGSAEVTMLPQSTVAISGKQAEQMVRLLEALKDHDDVQSVPWNMDIAGAVLAEYAPASVKLATVGYGQADKRAMGRAVALRLGLGRPPAPDAADALALALCHLHRAPLARRLARALAAGGRA